MMTESWLTCWAWPDVRPFGACWKSTEFSIKI
jgi:hypothetical protein